MLFPKNFPYFFITNMAASRTEKIGTIFTRVTGLIKAGAMKPEDVPIWYEVYKAFPPKYEPTFARPAVPKEIPNIFYKEDLIRAKFYKRFPNVAVDMRSNKPLISERFIEKYNELTSTGNYKNEDEVFEAVVLTMAIPEFGREPIKQISKSIETKTSQESEPPVYEKDEDDDKNIKLNFKVADFLKPKTRKSEK